MSPTYWPARFQPLVAVPSVWGLVLLRFWGLFLLLTFFYTAALKAQVPLHTTTPLPAPLQANLLRHAASLPPDTSSLRPLLAWLQQHNYFAATLQPTDTAWWLHPGPAYCLRVDSLSGLPLGLISPPNALRSFAQASTLGQVQHKAQALLRQQHQQGYPLAHYTHHVLRQTADTFFLDLRFQSGPLTRYAPLAVVGPGLKHPRLMQQITQLRSGHLFRQSDMQRAEARILALGYWRLSHAARVYFAQGLCYPQFYLERVPVNRFDALLGLLQGANGQLGWNGFLHLHLHNSLQWAERLVLEWNKTANATQTIRLDAAFPYLFASPWGLKAGFWLQQMDSQYVQRRFSPAVSYSFGAQLSVALLYQAELVLPGANTPASNRSSSSLVGVQVQHTGALPRHAPRAGSNVQAEFHAGQRSQPTASSTKLSALVRTEHYWSLGPRWVVRLAAQGALLWHGAGSYLPAEMHPLGGLHSLRGFYENEFRNPHHLLASLEGRWHLAGDSYLQFFADQAWWQSASDRQQHWPRGLGVGAGLATRAGLLQINYALPWYIGSPRLGQAKLHVGLLSYF